MTTNSMIRCLAWGPTPLGYLDLTSAHRVMMLLLLLVSLVAWSSAAQAVESTIGILRDPKCGCKDLAEALQVAQKGDEIQGNELPRLLPTRCRVGYPPPTWPELEYPPGYPPDYPTRKNAQNKVEFPGWPVAYVPIDEQAWEWNQIELAKYKVAYEAAGGVPPGKKGWYGWVTRHVLPPHYGGTNDKANIIPLPEHKAGELDRFWRKVEVDAVFREPFGTFSELADDFVERLEKSLETQESANLQDFIQEFKGYAEASSLKKEKIERLERKLEEGIKSIRVDEIKDLKTKDKKEHIRKKLEPIWSELKKTRSDIPRKKLKESFILEKSKDFWHGTEGALSKCEIRPARAPVEEPFIQPSTAGTEKEAHKKAVALACALKKCSPSFNQVYAVVVTQNGNNRELIVSSNDKANGPVRAPENSNAPKKCEDFKNLATNMKDGEHGLEFMLDDLTVRFVKPNADNLDERYHEHDAEQRALRWIHEQRKTHKDGRVVEMIMPTIPACQYCRGAIRETYGGDLDDSKLKVVLRDPKKECL